MMLRWPQTKVDCYGNRKDHRFCASQEPRISVDQRAITHTPATLDISHNVMIVPNEPTTEAPLAASAASSAPIIPGVETLNQLAVPTTIQVETTHRNGDTDHFYQHSHIRGCACRRNGISGCDYCCFVEAMEPGDPQLHRNY